jgi:hypothetical protein
VRASDDGWVWRIAGFGEEGNSKESESVDEGVGSDDSKSKSSHVMTLLAGVADVGSGGTKAGSGSGSRGFGGRLTTVFGDVKKESIRRCFETSMACDWRAPGAETPGREKVPPLGISRSFGGPFADFHGKQRKIM